MLAAGVRKYLRVNKMRIQGRIDAGDVFPNESFEPALGLRAIKSVARFGGKRMSIIFKLLEQILQSGQGRRLEFFAGIRTAEKNASIVPAGKSETAKAQQNFAGLGNRMNGDSARRQCHDWIKRGAREIEKSLRFAMGNKPSVLISRVVQIDPFEGFANRIALVEFNGQIQSQSGGAMSYVARCSFWQDEAEGVDRAAAVRAARKVQPQQCKRETVFHSVRRLSVGNG